MNNNIDFFGFKKQNRQSKYKKIPSSSSVNFLSVPKIVPYKKIRSEFKHSVDATFFKKESIRSRKLSKWGDADLDGSPNWFDCSPRKVHKDAEPIKKNRFNRLYTIQDKIYGKVKSSRVIPMVIKAPFITSRGAGKALQPLKRNRAQLSNLQGQVSGIDKDISRISPSDRTAQARLALLREKRQQAQQRISSLASENKQLAAEYNKFSKEDRELAKEASRIGGNVTRFGQRVESIASAPVTATGKLLKGASKTYSKEEQKAGRRFNQGTSALVGLFVPTPSSSRKISGGQRLPSSRGRGRPSGSYDPRYAQFGGVYEYRKYLREQRKLAKLQSKDNRQAMMAQSKGEVEMQSQDTQQYIPEEEVQSSQVQKPMQQEIQQQTQVQLQSPEDLEIQRYIQASRMRRPQQNINLSPEDQEALLRARQLQEQQTDSILNAPNINNGELKLNRPKKKEKTILEAPNFMQGQLRNPQVRDPKVGTVNEYGEVQMFDNMNRLGAKPVSNKEGDEYIEIDPVTGEPFVRKRPSEKWMTGEAL